MLVLPFEPLAAPSKPSLRAPDGDTSDQWCEHFHYVYYPTSISNTNYSQDRVLGLQLGFNSKTITIDPLPILMLFTDVVIHAHSTLEILVTSRAIIFFIRTNVEFTHVSLHAVENCIRFSTNHTNKASITFLNLALHQVIQRKGLFF